MRRVPLQVLLVTQYYRPELIGSAPFCADIAEWLEAHGRRVTVLTARPHYPRPEMFPAYRDGGPRREMVNGVPVERLRSWIPRRRSAPWRILGEAVFLLCGIGAILRGRIRRPQLVLSLCPSVLAVALGSIAAPRGARHVAIVHDIQSGLARGLRLVGNGWLLGLMRRCERLALNRADLVLVLSQEMREQLRAIGVKVPIEVVPLWVDTERVRPLPSPRRNPLTLLYSGNIGKKQGLGQIIELGEELQARRPEIEIVLRGSGSEAARLGEEIAKRRLRNTRLTALLARDDLATGLALGDIHLVPQDPDAALFAVPSKIFNIMAAGRPFIATALPGSPLWRLQHESRAFICVPPGDRGAFAEAVLRLADDEGLRAELGKQGRRYVERCYAKPKVLGDLLMRLDGLYAAS